MLGTSYKLALVRRHKLQAHASGGVNEGDHELQACASGG